MKKDSFDEGWDVHKKLYPGARKPKHVYALSGCCSKFFAFDIDNEQALHNCVIISGCPGNTRAICKLMEGMDIGSAIICLEGIPCSKGESCASQIALALTKYTKKHNNDET